jgi:hypothetical protein
MYTYHVCMTPLAAVSTLHPAPISGLRALPEAMALLLAIPADYVVVYNWFGAITLHVTSFTISEALLVRRLGCSGLFLRNVTPINVVSQGLEIKVMHDNLRGLVDGVGV